MTTMNIFDMADTWNDAPTTFAAIKMNVTDTASAAGSLLMDLQVGGVSKFSVSKSGIVIASTLLSSFDFQVGATGTLYWNGRSRIASPADGQFTLLNQASTDFSRLNFGGTTSSFPALKRSGFDVDFRRADDSGYAPINVDGVRAKGTNGFITFGASEDVVLIRDGAAAVLAQRNGTNPQTFRVYNTYTDASNYERGAFSWAANELLIGTQNAGTGSGRGIVFITANSGRWSINGSGHFVAAADNTYDIGASGATRPRALYLGGDLNVAAFSGFGTGKSATTLMNVAAGATGWSQLRLIQGVAPTSPVDGDVWREDNTNTGLKIRVNGVTKTITLA